MRTGTPRVRAQRLNSLLASQELRIFASRSISPSAATSARRAWASDEAANFQFQRRAEHILVIEAINTIAVANGGPAAGGEGKEQHCGGHSGYRLHG